MIQTHYDNPANLVGLVDNSGVRLFLIDGVRPMEYGILQLGDPDVTMDQELLPEGRSSR